MHEATAGLQEEAEKRGLWSGAVLLVRTTIRAARHGRATTVVTRAKSCRAGQGDAGRQFAVRFRK